MSSESSERFVRSAVLTGFGDNSQIKIKDWPLPKPGPGELEVRVEFCGVNFADIYTRIGVIRNKEPPFVLGVECSGYVTAIGDSGNNDDDLAETFAVGDCVVCYDPDGGLYRDTVVVSKKKCFHLPDGTFLRDGVVIFVNYLTAYFSLIEMGNLKQGETVLIQSCGGGVGWAATQLANTVSGVTVIGTASLKKHQPVFDNGVKYALEYPKYSEKIREISPKGVDVVIENQGGTDFNICQNLLKPFGRIVIIGANSMVTGQGNQPTQSNSINLEDLVMHNRSVSGMHLGLLCETENERVRRTFAKLCAMHKDKTLRIRMDSVFDFSKITEAIQLLEGRHNIGKVLINISHPKPYGVK